MSFPADGSCQQDAFTAVCRTTLGDSSAQTTQSGNVGVVFGIIGAVVGVIVLTIAGAAVYCWKKKKKRARGTGVVVVAKHEIGSTSTSADEEKMATAGDVDEALDGSGAEVSHL